MSKYPQFPVIDKSFLNKYFISLDPDKHYIPFSDCINYRNYRAKVSTLVDKFCPLFHMHPIS